MALHNYFSELLSIKGMEEAQLIRDDARILQDRKLTQPKRRSGTRHPSFSSSNLARTSPPHRPSRKMSDDNLISLCARSSKLEESRSSLELFYQEVAGNQGSK